LIAAKLPEISAVEPDLTLEGLRLVWLAPVVSQENDTAVSSAGNPCLKQPLQGR
jgi:hypothetical protein